MEDRNLMIEWYNRSLEEFGESDYRSLTWGDPQGNSARRRYEIIHNYVDLNTNSILEVGCGWGSLFDFGYAPKNYLGIDLNQKFIDIAKAKYVNRQFISADILECEIAHTYDIAIASGVAGNRGGPAWHPDLLYAFIKQLLESSHKAVINFPSIWSDVRSEHVEYFSPESVLSIAFRLTKKVQLIHFDRFDFFLIVEA